MRVGAGVGKGRVDKEANTRILRYKTLDPADHINRFDGIVKIVFSRDNGHIHRPGCLFCPHGNSAKAR